MAAKIITLFLFFISLASLVVLYAIKLSHHFRYLRAKDGKKAGPTSDFFYRNFLDKNDKSRWDKSWMLFPLMFPIAVDDESEKLNQIKKQIKNFNIAIYAALIIALIVVFFAAESFPEGIF